MQTMTAERLVRVTLCPHPSASATTTGPPRSPSDMDAPAFEVERFLRKQLDAASLAQLQVHLTARTFNRPASTPTTGAKRNIANRDCQPRQRHAAPGVRKLLKVYHRDRHGQGHEVQRGADGQPHDRPAVTHRCALPDVCTRLSSRDRCRIAYCLVCSTSSVSPHTATHSTHTATRSTHSVSLHLQQPSRRPPLRAQGPHRQLAARAQPPHQAASRV